ncbi:MAG: HAD family hydrolase, partial [Flavobacteriaceae bacterium]|nr:HAD family hydrolase [Flavobacteriaceae bacterium]
MNTPKKLVVFDIDGTLTDSLPVYHKVVIQSLKLMGIKEVDTDFYSYKYHTDSYTLKFNYENHFNKPFAKKLLNEFENILFSELQKYPAIAEINGAKVCVNNLLKANYAIAFATGSLLKPAKLKMNQCNIWYDESLIATSKISFDRETFVLQAIENAKSYFNVNEFEQIYSVGDGVWDLQTAQKLNLEFIG